ncbi:MAG: phosphate ABC transporter permease PstA [Archaeoglobaceae archaeon]|nr:phosphate ABC transporter permease PstA [Archaeoglobaceae archaeon]
MLRKLKNSLFLIYIVLATFLVTLPLFHIIFSVFINGFPVILKAGLSFLTETLPPPGEELAGIGPAILGTFILTFLSSLIGIPIATLAGIYAAEYPNSFFSRATRTLLLIMIEFPTILVSLFVMSIVVLPMGRFSAIAGAIALVIVMMPYVAVYTEQALKSVPERYREAAYALGLKRKQVVFRVMFSIARKGIVTGFLIGIAKAAGETAPILFTAGGAYRTFFIGLDKPVGAIPLLIYDLVQQPYSNYHEIAWGSALILLIVFLAIFIPVRLSVREVKL